MKNDTVLPKKYEIYDTTPEKYHKYAGKNKLSYSQYNSFRDPLYKNDYIIQYFLGVKLESGIFAEFGSACGNFFEDGITVDTNWLSESDVEILKKVPRPEGATGSEYAKEQKSALIHELQHGVQKIEDWNRGGQVNYFNQQDDALLAKKVLMMRDEIDRLPSSIPFEDRAKTVKEMFEKLDMSPIDKKTMEIVSDVTGQPNNELQNLVTLYGLDKRSTPYSPFEMYNNLAGEAEARLAQTRIDLTPEQRLENFPFKQGKFGLDINPDDALIWNEGADLLRRKSLLNQGLLD
jgi:hypothetical protein